MSKETETIAELRAGLEELATARAEAENRAEKFRKVVEAQATVENRMWAVTVYDGYMNVFSRHDVYGPNESFAWDYANTLVEQRWPSGARKCNVREYKR